MTNERAVRIILHALGCTENQGKPYRNYYAAEPTDPELLELASRGFVIKGNKIPGGMVYFYVTDEGRTFAMKNRPPAPKLNRSQKRYLRWLDISDVCPDSTFKDFLTKDEFKEVREERP